MNNTLSVLCPKCKKTAYTLKYIGPKPKKRRKYQRVKDKRKGKGKFRLAVITTDYCWCPRCKKVRKINVV